MPLLCSRHPIHYGAFLTDQIAPTAPYAHQLAAAITNGFTPHNDIFIFLGCDAWRKARALREIHAVLLIPPEDNRTPDKFLWDFVRGLSVLIMVTSNVGHQLIRHLGYELLNAGASVARVLLCYTDPPELIVYRGGGKCR